MFKHFNVLDTHFHHRYTDEEEMMRQHKLCFDSVTVIIKIKLMMGVNILFRAPKTMKKATYTMASLAKKYPLISQTPQAPHFFEG